MRNLDRCYTTYMRLSVSSMLTALSVLVFFNATGARATEGSPTFVTTLASGSTGPQVVLLQQALNSDLDTRITATGPGSPGNETDYFGMLTKAAVMRFQEKFASDILVPAGLSAGNGRVGAYTRAKLNALFRKASGTPLAIQATATPLAPTFQDASTSFRVNDSEKIDIYAGDKMLAAMQERLLAVMNAAITSGKAPSTLIAVKTTDVPSVVLRALSPQSGIPGSTVTVTATGVLANTKAYFGSDHIVRSITIDLSGKLSLIVPAIAPGLYDVALKSGGNVSNTMPFVVIDPRNPSVHIDSISPATTTFNGVITITGSGFSSKDNIVVTTFQKFTGVTSSDGKTMTITIAPDTLRKAAEVGNGTHPVSVSLSVMNAYGISVEKKHLTLML